MLPDEEKIAALKAIRDKARLENKRDAYKKQLSDDEDCFEEEEFEEDYDEDDEPEKPLPADDDGVNTLPHFGGYLEDEENLPILDIQFNGKNLENGEFNNEDLANANFSVSNLSGVNFSGSNLRGADFSGANLTGTDLSGADLTGAVFAGARLVDTNFTGAVMKHVVLTDVYLEGAILSDVVIDEITLEELQHLIEYMAKYYPHKLDLTKINLTMLDLTRIDFSKVNLRGVDFTGCDLRGVNIMELDLSECIISPEQIAQALGRIPSADELRRIMAPKTKNPKKSFKGLDFSDMFKDTSNFGIYNVAGFSGMSIDKIMNAGKKVFHHEGQAPVKDREDLEKIREQNRVNKEELRGVIEERKRRVLSNKSRQHDFDPGKGSNQR